MAAIDIAGFMSRLKDHAIEHGFHVHDERHTIETYSLRQAWEVDVHPEEGCDGPIDLYLSLEVDPRILLGFEDELVSLDPDSDLPEIYSFPLRFIWALPPLTNGPDLLLLATELAGVGGMELPIEVSAIDSFASATDAPTRALNIVGSQEVSLAAMFEGEAIACETLDRCRDVSLHLLGVAPGWL